MTIYHGQSCQQSKLSGAMNSYLLIELSYKIISEESRTISQQAQNAVKISIDVSATWLIILYMNKFVFFIRYQHYVSRYIHKFPRNVQLLMAVLHAMCVLTCRSFGVDKHSLASCTSQPAAYIPWQRHFCCFWTPCPSPWFHMPATSVALIAQTISFFLNK